MNQLTIYQLPSSPPYHDAMTRRWLIRCLFLLPILLCLAGYAWSVVHNGWLVWNHAGDTFELTTGSGVIQLEWMESGAGAAGWHAWSYAVPPSFYFSDARAPGSSFLSFRFYYRVPSTFPGAPTYQSALQVPYWFLLLLFSALFYLVWRKTPPTLNPKSAFPIEVRSQQS